jgi:hypothetical protein
MTIAWTTMENSVKERRMTSSCRELIHSRQVGHHVNAKVPTYGIARRVNVKTSSIIPAVSFPVFVF